MATTVWKGHLTFGLVSIPVRLFRAARPEKVSLHQLYRSRPVAALRQPINISEPDIAEPDIAEQYQSAPKISEPRVLPVAEEPPVTRIKQAAFTPDDGKPIPRADLVKGYEVNKGQYVVIEKEEIAKITPKTATEMEILEFVKLEEIDPVYLETSYYVVPEEAGEKAYALLFRALRQTGYVGLAQVAMHRREHVVILRPGQHGLLAHTMYYANEIRKDQEFRTDTSAIASKEMDLAVAFIKALTARFEPEKYKDTFREKLQAVIAGKVETPARTPSKAGPSDIAQALKKSLSLVRKPMASSKGKARKQVSGRK
jgi:DNA end-binding protein Ku